MTYPEFLEKLKQTPRDWEFYDAKRIRRADDLLWRCPISSLTPEHPRSGDFTDAATALEMSHDLTWQIVRAADGCEYHDPAIRKDLLAACGLEN